MKTIFARLFKDEKGLTLPEYGVGLALAILVGVAAMGGLSGEINSSMEAAGEQVITGGCDANGANCTTGGSAGDYGTATGG